MTTDPVPAADGPDAAYRLDAQLLGDLWIFRHVATCGSATAAAARLRVTQGAVSQRLIRAEGRIGARLFTRDTGALALTEAGSALLATMNDVAMRLTTTLSRFDRVQRLSLVVCCPPSLATGWLMPRLAEFFRLHPGVDLELRAEAMAPDRMEQEGVDLTIAYQDLPAPDIPVLATIQEKIVPVCAPDRRARATHAPREAITELHDIAPWTDGVRGCEWRGWKEANPDWPHRTATQRRFNLAHLAYAAAAEGQGVAMGRMVIVADLLRSGALVAATECAPVPGGTYRLYAYRPGYAGSTLRRFAGWLAQAMTDTQREATTLLKQPV